jgi:hypothetical protein
MIICVNGKCVGNMTMAELQIEFDVCGSELLLTVSRFDIHETESNQGPGTLQDLEMEWSNVGACASLKRKRVSFGDDRISEVEACSIGIEKDNTGDNYSDCELRGVEVGDYIADPQPMTKKSRPQKHTSEKVSPLDATSHDENEFSPKRIASNRSLRDRIDDNTLSSAATKDGGDGKEDSDDSEDGDENPWLGCVCGNTHPHPIKVFWIQCEGCEAWYNAAEECLGFDESTAEGLSNWCCWTCDPPVAGMGL